MKDDSLPKVSATPPSIDRYRAFQASVVPGVDALYRLTRAVLDSVLPAHASVLVAGAGGGREIETLGASFRQYQLVGVDPDSDMLEATRSYIETLGCGERAKLIPGYVNDVPLKLYDGATSIFVMHFVADDGSKKRYLESIRQRLPAGAPYLHVDVSYDSREAFERMASVYALNAQMGGIEPGAAASLAERITKMPILSSEATLELFAQNGFELVTRFFQGLWYTGWWLQAA